MSEFTDIYIYNEELRAENALLKQQLAEAKNEIARLSNRTNFYCQCGGVNPLAAELAEARKGIDQLQQQLAEAKLPSVEHVQLVYELQRVRKDLERLEHRSVTLDTIYRNVKAGAVTTMWIEDFIQKRDAAIAAAQGDKTKRKSCRSCHGSGAVEMDEKGGEKTCQHCGGSGTVGEK